MKFMKYVFPLLVVLVLLTLAVPVAAQGPVYVQTTGGRFPIFVRTAGTNEDPFGGFCRNYFGSLSADQKDTAGNTLGAPASFGLNPFGRCDVSGGVPSDKSGDGTSPRKAISVAGAWDPNRQVPENELPACATAKIPAGSSRWFKADTWKNKELWVWVDDEKDGTTTPSGKAVFGAADAYMFGTASGDAWQANAFFDSPNSVADGRFITGPSLEGFVLAVYDPDNLKPNFNYPAPNAAILTVNVSSATGSLRRSGNFYEGGTAVGTGVSVAGLGAGGVHGYGQYNASQPSHLLWYQGKFDGWAYFRVYNQMIWDGVASVCSYRATNY